MLQTLLELEGNILLWLQENLRNDFGLILFQIITHFGTGGIFWIALTAVLLINKKTRRVGSMCTVSIVLTFLVNNLILKNLVARTSPYFIIEGLTTVGMRPSDFSFPSGHTAISFCVACVLFRNLPKKWGSLFLILAVLIAFSRLYLYVHYPTDVLAGILLGLIVSVAANVICRLAEPHIRKIIKS